MQENLGLDECVPGAGRTFTDLGTRRQQDRTFESYLYYFAWHSFKELRG